MGTILLIIGVAVVCTMFGGVLAVALVLRAIQRSVARGLGW